MVFIRFVITLLAAIGFSAAAIAADWKRADTHHFTIYSDGRESQLQEFATEVEQFDSLLRFLFKKPTVEEPNKLTIYLVRNADSAGDLLGSNSVAGFYSSRLDGSFAVATREYGGRDEDLSGRRVLFHEYAHHFMFRNFSQSFPSWFVEGFAEYVSTAEFDKDGRATFGKPAAHRAREIQYFDNVNIERLLGGRSLDENLPAFYGWSWALTHMLYSREEGFGDKLAPYFAGLNAGKEPLAAAEDAFGDLGKLGRQLRGYVRRSMAYYPLPKPLPFRDALNITEISDAEGETIALTMRRLGGDRLKSTRRDLLKHTASAGAGAEAFYQLAEAEYTLAHRNSAGEARYNFGAAHVAVDRSLALDENHVKARVLKGKLLLEPFDHDEDNADPALWAQAREQFLAANQTEPLAPAPLYHFAQTYIRQSEDNEMINPALAVAFERAPEVREVRVAYAFDMARLGQYDFAIRLLEVLANNPHGDGGTREIIESIEEMKAKGIKGVFRMAGEEVEDPGDEDGEESGDEEDTSDEDDT